MQLPIIFEYEEKVKIRTINIGGEIWFFAKDVCDALGIVNTGSAYERLDKDDIGQTDGVDAKGRKIKSYIVSEFGLYELILQSTKPEAKKFKRWVTHDVLPSIRKTGGYLAPGAKVALPIFVRRFNENWDRIDAGYFSVISELFIRLYGRLEHAGYLMPDKTKKGIELRPDVSAGKHFSTWLKTKHPDLKDNHKPYSHKLPNGIEVDARQYPNEMWHLFADFIDNVWLRQYSVEYFKDRDPKALEYLPKLLPPK